VVPGLPSIEFKSNPGRDINGGSNSCVVKCREECENESDCAWSESTQPLHRQPGQDE